MATRNIGHGLVAILACTPREEKKCLLVRISAKRIEPGCDRPIFTAASTGLVGVSCGPATRCVTAKGGTRNVR